MKQHEREKVTRKRIYYSIALVLWLYIALRVMKAVVEGSVPFWYDPARDLVAAAANLEKISLLGPPTGVPGLFYGPYWIWLLSAGVFLFRDPRWVLLLAQTLPYLVLLPWLLLKLAKVWGEWVSLLVFGLFSVAYVNYYLFLWNPHLAPLLFLGLVSLVVKLVEDNTGREDWKWWGATGLVSGLVVNFHFSFGIAVAVATGGFLFGWMAKAKEKKGLLEQRLVQLGGGLAAAFVPFAVFEWRHGFNQMRVLAQTVEGAYFKQATTVGIAGITKLQIVNKFLGLPSGFMGNGGKWWMYGSWLVMFLAGWLFWQRRKKLTETEKALMAYVLLVLVALLILYLTSGNPIWEYHFIGAEMALLVGAGLLAGRVKWFRWLLAAVLAGLLFRDGRVFIETFGVRANELDSLTAKREIVETVLADAGGEEFGVSVYTPAVYIPDYEYLLWWLGKQEKAQWVTLEEDVRLVYLILPWTEEHVRLDFINYKTPNDRFETTAEWKFESGKMMYRRVRLE